VVVHTEPAGEQSRYRLRCTESALRGFELDLLHPFEPIEPVATEPDPTRAGRLADWRLYHQAFLLEQALGPGALLAVQPGRLEIAPFQLVPVMRALAMSRPRLLLADGVGLGKTVQAGLVLAELIARRRAHRILVVSPAGPLLAQWHAELRSRFGLRFAVVKDWGTLQEQRRALELGSNPFDHLAYCLTSVDFAKQEKVLQDLERSAWDVVVIDEAHHCVRLGGAGDAEDSRRRRLAEVLARQADGLLLLTATPHDGFDAHFASLVELLDPSLVDGRGGLRGEHYRRHVVRRLKSHIKDPKTGAPLFRTRQVHPRPVAFRPDTHPRFAAFQEAVLALVAPRLRAAVRQRRYGEVLAFVALLKRSVSTAGACRNTLQVVADRYAELSRRGAEAQEARRQRLRTLRDYRRRLERYGALSAEEEQDHAALEAEDIAAEILEAGADELLDRLDTTRREVRREQDRQRRVEETQAALAHLVALADSARAEDPKREALLAELEAIREAEPAASVLVYTEYTDSQDAVLEWLADAVQAGRLTGQVLAISGQDDEDTRTRVTERFAAEDGLVLVSTDATAEGLNLHQRCHHLVHLELPYNPNRLEQRNGRIDRYGQREDPQVRYLFLAGTFEERLLLRLIAKYERARARLTFVPNTLGALASEASAASVRLLEGLAEEDLSLFRCEPAPVAFGADGAEDTTGTAYRELLAEIERTMDGFERTARTATWLGEAGLNADVHQVEDALRARATGARLGPVELTAFVRAAVEGEGGSARDEADGIQALYLPPDWTFGLDDLPGYDPGNRVMRLTPDPDCVRDEAGRSLGYLGCAHPLVRRALERVRSLRFGAGDGYLERRVSAARGDGAMPEVLLTFLGAVQSAAGPELERVVTVCTDRSGAVRAETEAGAWLALTTGDRAVPTRGLWERHFAGWAHGRQREAARAAREAFAPIAADFGQHHAELLDRERRDLDAWLAARAEALCGAPEVPQAGLFDGLSTPGVGWRAATDPTERLAGFAKDPAVPAPRRREAEGVLALHAARVRALERRAALQVPEPALLGYLMLVPEGTA
jgi:ERCC4-related helicase